MIAVFGPAKTRKVNFLLNEFELQVTAEFFRWFFFLC